MLATVAREAQVLTTGHASSDRDVIDVEDKGDRLTDQPIGLIAGSPGARDTSLIGG
jgi:hypothetical protein